MLIYYTAVGRTVLFIRILEIVKKENFRYYRYRKILRHLRPMAGKGGETMTIQDIIYAGREIGASDIHISEGMPLEMRVNGWLSAAPAVFSRLRRRTPKISSST